MCTSDSDCETDPEAGPGYFCGSTLPPYGSNYFENPANALPGTTLFLQTGAYSQMTFDGQSVLHLPALYHPPLMSDITIFAVVSQELGNNGYVVGKGVNDRVRDFGLYLRSSKEQVWVAYGAQDTGEGFRAILYFHGIDLSSANGTFHSVAAVVDSAASRAVLYVDGVAVSLQAPLPSPPEFRPGVTFLSLSILFTCTENSCVF